MSTFYRLKKNKSFHYALNKATLSMKHFNLTFFYSSDHNMYSSFSYEQGNVLFVLQLGRLIVVHSAEEYILSTVLNEGKLEENRFEKCANFF